MIRHAWSTQCQRLVSGAGIQVLGLFLSLLQGIVLARWLGSGMYGMYLYVLTWAMGLAMLAVFGMDRLLVREVSKGLAQWNRVVLLDLVSWADRMGLVISLALAVGLVAVALLWPGMDLLLRKTLLASACCVPVMAVGILRLAALRGADRVAQGLVYASVWPPLVVLAVAGTGFLMGVSGVQASHVLILNAGIGVWMVWVSGRVWRRTLPAIPEAVEAAVDVGPGVWRKAAFGLFAITALDAVIGRLDTLALGFLCGPGDVGVYSAAARWAALVSLPLNMAVLTTAHHVAKLHAAGDRAGLQHLTARLMRLVLPTAMGVAVVLMVFGDRLLQLYGSDFTKGWWALIVLCVGHVVNVAVGPVATLLIMTGHERDVTVGLAIAVVINAGCSMWLIPGLGMNGAALAAAAGLVAWNVVMAVQVQRHLKILPVVWSIAKGDS